MARDPLAALQRLRRLETAMARRHLAERLGAIAAAEVRQALAHEALVTEARAPAGDFAAWLPRGLAERDRAGGALAHAEQRGAEAQQAVAEARAAERSVEWLREEQAAAHRRLVARKTQAALDDAAARRRRER